MHPGIREEIGFTSGQNPGIACLPALEAISSLVTAYRPSLSLERAEFVVIARAIVRNLQSIQDPAREEIYPGRPFIHKL